MERFVRGEISVRCDTQGEIVDFLHELASRYPQIQWRDSGKLSNYMPMIERPSQYVVFYWNHDLLTVGRFSRIIPEENEYVVDYRDLQCSHCEPVVTDDLAFILNET